MKSNGFATVLLLIPVLTVPALAIFGIPQFAPVVASPLEEGRDHDRETRVGNSARHKQDGMFDDIEGFDSEPETNVKSVSSLRKRDSSRIASRDGGQRRSDSQSLSTSPDSPTWNNDLESVSNWPADSKRSPSRGSNESGGRDRLPVDENAAAFSDRNNSMRFERRSRTNHASDEVRQAAADDQDQGIVQAAFSDEVQEREPRRGNGNSSRPRTNSTRTSGRRDSPPEALTWAAAVERLNEYDIRNFRLEPGDRSGQFVFICTYATPEAPTVAYRFEAGADEPLKAVEKVLEQVVEWRQKQ